MHPDAFLMVFFCFLCQHRRQVHVGAYAGGLVDVVLSSGLTLANVPNCPEALRFFVVAYHAVAAMACGAGKITFSKYAHKPDEFIRGACWARIGIKDGCSVDVTHSPSLFTSSLSG